VPFPEQPGPITHGEHYHIRRRGVGDGSRHAGQVSPADLAALLVMDLGVWELRPQHSQQRISRDANALIELRELRDHVIGKRVTAEERLRVIGARPDHRNPLRRLQGEQTGRIIQQHNAGLRHPSSDVTVSRGIQVDAPV
jgi:hypothetical protein